MALRRLGDKPSSEPMMAWFGATLDLNRALDLNKKNIYIMCCNRIRKKNEKYKKGNA